MKQHLLNLTDPITAVPGIGPSRYFQLQKKQVKTILDFLNLWPIRHENYSLFTKIASVQPDETITVTGRILRLRSELTRRRGLTVQKAQISDNTGELTLIWFNHPYLKRNLREGFIYNFAGKCHTYHNQTILQVNEYEETGSECINTMRIVPYYSDSLGISSKFIRQKVFWILSYLTRSDFPEDVLKECSPTEIMELIETYRHVHFPKNADYLNKAKNRVAFEQLTLIKYYQLKEKARLKKGKIIYLHQIPRINSSLFIKNLPFRLTKSQILVLEEITRDFENKQYVNRLLMGDVGTGKTVILAYLSWLMALNNRRTIVLAPTTVLAEQHRHSFTNFLKFTDYKVELITSKSHSKSYQQSKVIIGTHALLFRQSLPPAALLIIDEQHKFGVLQRERLLLNANIRPHILTVSATPIPRSLALTLYGHLNISYLTDKPFPNQIKTYLVPEIKRAQCYDWIAKNILKHHSQAYIVCPAIEAQSKNSHEEIKTVNNELNKLKNIFSTLKIAAIYSKHPDRDKIINDFIQGKYQILITTSLIEVGLDIPGANIMLIENAERFGLSQLHQLRGRIGRRDVKAYCFLFSDSQSREAWRRLEILTQTDNAIKIAEADLRLRGPGNLLGEDQHGFNQLTLEQLFDHKLSKETTETAQHILDNYPKIEYTSILWPHYQKENSLAHGN